MKMIRMLEIEINYLGPKNPSYIINHKLLIPIKIHMNKEN